MPNVDLIRELAKASDTLAAAQTHLARHAEANAALHCATTVMYSPLHARVTAAIQGIDQAIKRESQHADYERLATVLLDLDRCEHGRHRGDPCADHGGESPGNPHMKTGSIVGYGHDARPIVMPERGERIDPAAWRGRHRPGPLDSMEA